jgi:outer membrane protein OmpA-like peptidoglycan-associated protein
MRKLLPFLLCCFLALTSLQAQQERSRDAFSAKLLFVDYGRPNDIDGLEITNGIEIAYIRNLLPWLNVGVPLKAGVINVQEDINNRTFFSLDGVLQLQLPRPDSALLTPYLMGGAGMNWETDNESQVQIPVGAGVNIRLGGRSYLNLQGEYRISQEDNRNNLQLGIGYLHRLGKMDADGDGIADALDECPDIPGTEATKGCPDQDQDGIADQEDNCPARPGSKKLKGCPDTDGDGIADDEDDCPEEAGEAALGGCPDTDMDGVADADDKCPNEAGSVATMGCPDTDGDGIADNEDDCPLEKGTAAYNGCPFSDRDSDGVADEKDDCPDEPGNFELNGCPDTDADGVADKDDLCPRVAGQFSGCPDTDGDGVHDGIDACPDRVGAVSNKGCPELKKEEREVLDFAMRAVQFELGEARLKKESEEVLDQIAAIMNRYPGYQLKISGHTDSIGDADNNKLLSEERAKACYQYLASVGVDVSRIQYEGFGEEKPIADNDRSAGRRKNRRVEFDLYIE